MPDIKRHGDGDHWIRNNSQSDYVFPIVETETKSIVRKQIVQTENGQEIWDVEDEVEVEKTVDQIHLPPSLDPQDRSRVEVTDEELEQLRERTNFDKMVADHTFDLDSYHAKDA